MMRSSSSLWELRVQLFVGDFRLEERT